jgi:hypothetical protein
MNEPNLNPYLFTFCIQGWGSFIQKQNMRLPNESTSYGNALFLATRELSSFVSYSGVVFLWTGLCC